MVRFTKPLTALLAISFGAIAVNGQNACLTGDTSVCIPGHSILFFEECGIKDEDIEDLEACLDTVGREDIVTLILSRNELATVPAGLFGGLPTLQRLTLASNAIATIEAGAFTDLVSLNVLALDDNMLSSVPAGLFVNLPVLGELSLDANAIETIADDAFTGLESLRNLYIAFNLLETLPANVFAGMTNLLELALVGNNIGLLEAGVFTDLVAVEFLYLEGNELETLPANLFASMGALRALKLPNNKIATIEADAFAGLGALVYLELHFNRLETLPANTFAGLASLMLLVLAVNTIGTIEVDAFAGLVDLESLYLNVNQLETIPANSFSDLGSLQELFIDDNIIGTIEADAFAGLDALEHLFLVGNKLETIPGNLFAAMGFLHELDLSDNMLDRLPVDAFTGLSAMEVFNLGSNSLTTLPAGLFDGVGSGTSLETLVLDDPGLQCVPTIIDDSDLGLPTTVGTCDCTPAKAVSCEVEETCAAGAVGYTCVVADDCADDEDCDTDSGEVCCLVTNVCEAATDVAAGACGDPHMTGFRGQKFDFTGEDGGWYTVVSDLPRMHLNMRVTSPVPSVPEITYITGISILIKDTYDLDHTIVISVADPHSLESSCPVEKSSCLADGVLNVVVDGEEVLLSPGEVSVASGVAIAAVNLPGACRSFGFEKYWERKRLERLAQAGRKLSLTSTLQDMSDWILADPTATNIVECEEYVASATADGGVGVFAKQSEHVSFQIMTPAATIRLSHGRLHQLPMRDPTNQFDLPDHLAWQMNLAIEHSNMGLDATGILGETLVPTVDDNGTPIMQGMDVIRGQQEDYRVKGPLGITFAQSQYHE